MADVLVPDELEKQMEGAEKHLTFAIGDEEFGIDIRFITEIIGVQRITTLPDVPEFIKGVINLRGRVIPVIDMRLRFGKQEREYDERTCIIVTHTNDSSVGLIVDTVAEVIDIEQDQIDPPPRIANSSAQEFIQGLGRVEDDVKILLNLQKVLYDETTASQIKAEVAELSE